MREMIREEIRSISSLQERVIFKELMEGVFLSLYETNERMYQDLEHRIMDELAYDINRYRIRTGVVERAYLDQSHHIMSAMQEEDLVCTAHSAKEIREHIETDGTYRLSTVLLQCDYLTRDEILRGRHDFQGIITAGSEYPVKIRLEQSTRYLSQVEHLYHLFMANGIPWKTVNIPYLFKMADICIDQLPEEIGDKEEVMNLRVNFNEYNDFVHYDMVPIWNIAHLKLDSIGFPVACKDHRNYEHVVSIRKYGAEHAYLVSEKSGIQSVRQNGEKLLITGAVENVKKWDVFIIRAGQDHKIDRYSYPVLENLRKDDFSERFQKKTGRSVKTRAELERFIRGFGLEDYIEYEKCILGEKTKQQETYSMNFFMEDEIRDREAKKSLILYFRAKGKQGWLLRDLASFIVSEVQELYPEYQCCGELLETI